jgi:hypothetical protein
MKSHAKHASSFFLQSDQEDAFATRKYIFSALLVVQKEKG